MYAAKSKATVIQLYDPALDADSMQTLSLRMERQQDNALAIAQYLLAHPLVRKVNYPGLPGSGENAAAKGLRGFGGVLSFEVAPGVNSSTVLDSLHVFRLAVVADHAARDAE